jgi:erythronate-4-phosphate dehydrogenase
MRIVVDQNIPGVRRTFARHGHVLKVEGRSLDHARLADADALIVRSVTPVDQELLHDTGVGFVGTTTIGTDHLDTDYLGRAGIRWASAPGCNADAAAQYSLAMILLSLQRTESKPAQRRVGIVGRGNVGGRLLKLLSALGLSAIACDPPLADQGVTGLCAMEEIFACDVISLHVPLTRSGAYPTFQLFGGEELDSLQSGTLLVNSSRGAVIDGKALKDWLASERGHAALDVWPGEPDIDPELLNLATVATPHVAGYSQDGKYRGCEMIYAEFCDWLGIDREENSIRPSGHESLPAISVGHGIETVVRAVLHACPVKRDDAAIRTLLEIDRDLLPGAFDALRRDYPKRRDFGGWVLPEGLEGASRPLLLSMGFATPGSV